MKEQFVWASLDQTPPGRWDLRLLGWQMLRPDDQTTHGKGIPWILDCREYGLLANWRAIPRPERVAAVGADDADLRARMLEFGMGEALPSAVAVVELAARLTRLKASADALPRHRRAGPVLLDLFHRDGLIAERWLGLHPREFGLLWRLAQIPGERVSRRDLLRDVWRLNHEPETNSLEVHISRLRAKLAVARAAWLVETHPQGGYRLGFKSNSSFFGFHDAREEALDMIDGLGNGGDESILTVSPVYATK